MSNLAALHAGLMRAFFAFVAAHPQGMNLRMRINRACFKQELTCCYCHHKSNETCGSTIKRTSNDLDFGSILIMYFDQQNTWFWVHFSNF